MIILTNLDIANFMMGFGAKYVEGYLEESQGRVPVDLIDGSLGD